MSLRFLLLSIAEFSQLRFRLIPIRSYVCSTHCNGVSHRQNVLSGANVSVVARPTIRAISLSDVQRQSLKNVTVLPIAFRTREPLVRELPTIYIGSEKKFKLGDEAIALFIHEQRLLE